MTHVEEIRSCLPEGSAALIYEDCVIQWLTGFYTDNGCVCITKDCGVLLTDSRYSEAASRIVSSVSVQDSSFLTNDVADLLKKQNISTIYLEQNATTISQLGIRKRALEGFQVIIDSHLDEWVRDFRSVKTDEEIHNLKIAQQITDDGFSYILNRIAVGKSEKEIALDLEFYMRKQGAEKVSFDFIVVSGKNGSLPHGIPSDKKIEYGDFVTLDFGAVYGGMHSDMTRTIGMGKVSEKQELVYSIVLQAQQYCLDSLKAGVSGVDGDAFARSIIETQGYGKYFGHSTGHGVGYQIHEYPNLSSRNENLLRKGNVVTVEPGIYLPGEFGVRIEDMALIQEEKIENLTHSEKSLLLL